MNNLLTLPDFKLKEIIKDAEKVTNDSYPNFPRFYFERKRIRDEYIGSKIMSYISKEG